MSLAVRAGEIVGLAGLVGTGRTEIARLLFGADRLDAGEVLVGRRAVSVRSPRDAARHGIAMLPESRKEQGLLMLRSIRENVTLAPAALRDRRACPRRRGARAGRALAQRLDVRAPSTRVRVGTCRAATSRRCCSPSGSLSSRAC